MTQLAQFDHIDKAELQDFLSTCSESTKVYLGVDSERVKIKGVWYADYIGVVVVHKNGNNGCRIFHQVIRDVDYDKRKDKPTMRLMNEIYHLAALYKELEHLFAKFETELHMDINSVKGTGSNHVIDQARGYIRGVCGLEPKSKPDAWAASFAADRAKDLYQARQLAAA